MKAFYIIRDSFGLSLEECGPDGASWTMFLNDAKRFKTSSSAERFILKMKKGMGWPYHVEKVL